MNDVENITEVMSDAKTRKNPLGMSQSSVGEYELATRKSMERPIKRRIACNRRMIDVMHIIEERIRGNAMERHQSP